MVQILLGGRWLRYYCEVGGSDTTGEVGGSNTTGR